MLDKSRVNDRILIVDDVESIRLDLKNILNGMGFVNIREAEDGKIALDDLKVHAVLGTPYNLIFLDINMPTIDGIELLKTLRSMVIYSTTPVFIVTTENNKDSVVKAIAIGATNYILKPYNPKIVVEKILKMYNDQ